MAMFDKKPAEKKEEERAEVDVPVREPAKAAAPVSPTQKRQPGSQAVVGATIKVKGDISGDEDLIVEGAIEGNVRLDKNDLTIAETARVHANLSAKVVRIQGEVIGDVRGLERIVVAESGRVQGNLSAPRVVVEDGAKFRGSIEMDGFESKTKKTEG